MATWPANAETDWNTKMKAFVDVEHNTDATHNIPDATIQVGLSGSAVASIFGTRTFNDTTPAALAESTVYASQCDGYLTVSGKGSNATEIYIRIKNGSAPSTSDSAAVDTDVVATVEANANLSNGVTVPIRKDDYIYLAPVLNGTDMNWISFLPIGTGGLVDQT